jgi:hypothetical protein
LLRNRQRTQRTLRPRDFRTSEFWAVDGQTGNNPKMPKSWVRGKFNLG